MSLSVQTNANVNADLQALKDPNVTASAVSSAVKDIQSQVLPDSFTQSAPANAGQVMSTLSSITADFGSNSSAFENDIELLSRLLSADGLASSTSDKPLSSLTGFISSLTTQTSSPRSGDNISGSTASAALQDIVSQLGDGVVTTDSSGSYTAGAPATDSTSSAGAPSSSSTSIQTYSYGDKGSGGGTIGGTDSVTQDDPKGGHWSDREGRHTKTDAVFHTGGYTVDYTQRDGGTNILKITDSKGKDVTPSDMANGTNGTCVLPNGALVNVSGSGANVKCAVMSGSTGSAYQFGKGGGEQASVDPKQFMTDNLASIQSNAIYTTKDTTANDPSTSAGATFQYLQTGSAASLGDASVEPPVTGAKWQDNKDFKLYPQDGGPQPSDVHQGNMGDCYLCSTLASMAECNPNMVKDAIKDNGDGTYGVKMYDPSGKQITVQVSDKTMSGGNSTTGQDGKPNWSSIMEKAYDKYNSVYKVTGDTSQTGKDGIGNGGRMATVMKSFTGKDANMQSQDKDTDSDKLGKQIQDALKNGQPVAAGTTDHHHQGGSGGGVEIIDGHAYTVTKAYQKDGKWFVQVRNPWGKNTADLGEAINRNDNGYVTLSMDDYKQWFNNTTFSGNDPSNDNGQLAGNFKEGNGAGDGDG